MNILNELFGTSQYVSRNDTGAESPAADPNDIRAFTPPDARHAYGQPAMPLGLEHDIRYELMRGGPWQPDVLDTNASFADCCAEERSATAVLTGVTVLSLRSIGRRVMARPMSRESSTASARVTTSFSNAV